MRLDPDAVVIEHLAECLEAAILHVGVGQSDVSQRTNAEVSVPGANVCRVLVESVAVWLIHTEDIVPPVAGSTIASSVVRVEVLAELLLLGKLNAVSAAAVVIGRIDGHHRANELGKGARDTLNGDPRRPKRLLEEWLVVIQGVELRHQGIEPHPHLDRVLDRHQDLGLQAFCPFIPKEAAIDDKSRVRRTHGVYAPRHAPGKSTR